jgi:Cysteine-rich CPCC
MRTSSPAATRCLCCGFRTLSQPEAFELCEVCWWQDDGQDDRDADEVRGTVNGTLSLSEARRNFKSFGAAELRFVSHVRMARANER